ncbi:centrosomal protein of 57 kDa-like [Styela clava]
MATSTLFDDPSIPSFHEYPTRRPFLNSDITRPPGKPSKSYPESNSEAVLSALKGLQEKIRKLELERAQAEKNLKSLATETNLYKDLLSSKQSPTKSSSSSPEQSPEPHVPLRKTRFASPLYAGSPISHSRRDAEEVESQLRGADTRCNVLERQLENMRKMVQNAEKERSDALERQIALERDRGRITAEHRQAQEKLAKLSTVETQYKSLAQEKAATESRITDLEEKLKYEEHQRKLLADKAAQLQSEAESNRILLKTQIPTRDAGPQSSEKPRSTKATKKTTKKKKQRPQSAPQPQQATRKVVRRPAPQFTRQAGQPHYRLNLADVPFVTGTNPGASHAVAANLQKVLFDLKHHNPIYCNDIVVSENRMDEGSIEEPSNLPNNTRGRPSSAPSQKSMKKKSMKPPLPPSSTEQDLSELLVALQDEFGKMTFEHQVLVKQLGETTNGQLKDDLEKELESVVQKMEQKADQIATVRRHRAILEDKRKKTPSEKMNKPTRPLLPLHQQYPHVRSRSASGSRMKQQAPSCANRKGCSVKSYSASSSPAGSGKLPGGETHRNRLAFLRDMKTVHAALRKDDISWD